MVDRRFLRNGRLLLWVIALASCSTVPPSNVKSNARLTPSTKITRALTQLPEPRTKIPVAVYGLRDQTGQYKASPDSPYSTEITQGAATMLVDALQDSGWYIPVEREGLQNLLTERRIVRAIESPSDKGKPIINLPNLLPASLIIEGGITGYDSNVRTGGKGANFLGIGASTQYRVDQVTVQLRSVDIRNGEVINSVSVTKTIYSYQFDASVYRFTNYEQLLQGETGYTTNEPAQLAIKEAIEAAVIHLTIQGIRDRVLELKYPQDWYNNPVIQSYLKENEINLQDEDTADDEPIPMKPQTDEGSYQVVRPLMASAGETAVTKPAPSAGETVVTRESTAVPAFPSKQPTLSSVPAANPSNTSATSPATSPATLSSSQDVTPAVKQDASAPNVKNSSSSDDIFKMYWQNK